MTSVPVRTPNSEENEMGTTESPKLGFESDIKPLFRAKDRDSMLKAFDLWSYADVVAHSDTIAEQLSFAQIRAVSAD